MIFILVGNGRMKVKFKKEKFADILDELKPVFPEHWKEIANDQDSIPLDPDYETYLQLEEAGNFVVVTARLDNDEIVGYILTFVRPHLHYKTTLFGCVDIYYVKQEFRNGGVGLKFFEFYLNEMKKLKIVKLTTMCKVQFDHGPLFEYLGFKHIEDIYAKLL